MNINNLLEFFLFSDVYENVEKVINKNLVRKNGYLLLEQKELNKINSFIMNSIWFKFLNNNNFNYEKIIKKIMILEENDLLKIHDKKLIIKKFIPYGNIRNEFRNKTNIIDIKEIVYKYLKILNKSNSKEIFNIYKFIENDFNKSFNNEQLTFKLISFYSIDIFLYSILYIDEIKNFNFKLNNKVLDISFINFISKSFNIIIFRKNELKIFNEKYDLKKNELNELIKQNKQLKNSLIEQNKNLYIFKNDLKELRLLCDNKRKDFYKEKKINSDQKNLYDKSLKIIEQKEQNLITKIEHLTNIINSNSYDLNNFNKNKSFLENDINLYIKQIENNNYNIKQSFRMINYKLQMFFNN